MKQYLNLLKDINDNGMPAMYRNGVRYSLFNKTMEFDLRDGFPLVTTKPINWRTAFKETLWFITGDSNTSSLVEKDVINIWYKWQLHKEDLNHPEKTYIANAKVGDIGPMYGSMWRRWPRNLRDGRRDIMSVAPDVDTILRNSCGSERTHDLLRREHCVEYIDQLWNMVNALKVDPFTSRHYVTAHHPGYVADPNLSPQDNILRGNGCLNSCHRGFQCMVRELDGELHLSLMFEMGSSDAAIGQVGLVI